MPIKLTEKRDGENNREYAYRLLRSNIMTLQLMPGVTLNEGELAELLGISRTPIHEAIIMLKEESLVDVIPQSGSRVSLINIEILKEGNFLRSVIEPEIIRQVAGNIPDEKMKFLADNLKEQKEALENEEKIDSFFKLDDKFHHLLYTTAGKNKTWYAIKKVSSHYDRVRYLDAIMNKTDLSVIHKEHRDIYHMLLLGLPVDFDLKYFYERHLGTYRKHFQEILEKYPEYFC